MQSDNNRLLSEMRETVDERLQKTLEERLGQSFRLVSDSLEQVYKGLGEMQTLASGVGDLKKVLSNVKTRGILGEIQLAAILEQILSPEQYVENLTIKDGSRVEFAVKLPGDESSPVYLPIDAKFPADAYNRLVDAYDSCDSVLIDSARKNLEHSIKASARSISEKYIDPPLTTDFAIMFLPVEGLYAEVIRLGLIESLQTLFKVNIAGPTTMAAILNSLQMGFKTLAIQKSSGETWRTLSAVKTEFARFENVLIKAQRRLGQAGSELDLLIGVRTRMIMNKLNDVTELPVSQKTENPANTDGLSD
jgi:DNA recombination protein RmuC